MSAHLLGQDVIWVDRGSVVNFLAVWRAHGLDWVLRECWDSGVVLSGESARSLCWFTGGTTDSFGDVHPFGDGLGFLPFTNVVHYGARREQLHRLIAPGTFADCYATDAGAGLHFSGTELVAAISDRKDTGAYTISRATSGGVTEQVLEVT